MTTQAEVDRLSREVAQLREAVMARRFGLPSVVLTADDPSTAIERVVAKLPDGLKTAARRKLQANVISLPWIEGRNLGGARA